MAVTTNQTARGVSGILWTAATVVSLGLAAGVVRSLWSTTASAVSKKKNDDDEFYHQKLSKVEMAAGERTAEVPDENQRENEAARVAPTMTPRDNSETASTTTHTPPSTPIRQASTPSTKAKKWRDRLSAKKQNKLKQHQKLREESLKQ